MKKFTILIFALIMLLFCGCTNDSLYTVSYEKPVIISPDEETAYTINGYKDTTPIQESEISSNQESSFDQSSNQASSEKTESVYDGKFLGNINTKKLHKTTCSYIKKTKEENIEIFEDINSALLKGYSVCKRCLDS